MDKILEKLSRGKLAGFTSFVPPSKGNYSCCTAALHAPTTYPVFEGFGGDARPILLAIFVREPDDVAGFNEPSVEGKKKKTHKKTKPFVVRVHVSENITAA